MKISEKVKQYIVVLAVTCIAVLIYMICYAKGAEPLIAFDKDKPVDGLIMALIENNGAVKGNILQFCQYNIQNLFMIGLGFICKDIWTGINIYYFFTFFLISAAMYWYLRKLEISFPVAVGIAVLTAFLPFHVNRGEGQMLTSNFFLIPLYMGIMHEVIYEKITDSYHKAYIILMCMSPLIDVRVSVMMLLIFGILILHRRDAKVFRCAGLYWGVLLVSTAVVGFASSAFQSDSTMTDSINLAKDEGLRILDMIMPLRYHIADRLSNLRLEYDIQFSASGESGLNTMGILFSIGFVVGMLELFFGKKGDKRISWISWISILVILIANIHGLNLLLEYFGLHLAYWNRMGAFILVGSAAILAILADTVKKFLQKRVGTVFTFSILAVVGILSFLELLLRQNMPKIF